MTPDDLVEMELIKRLKYAYMRCIDQKLWDELRGLFVDDAVVAYSNGAYTHEGADNIVEWLRSSMGAETFHSSHRIHHPEIELTGPTTATGSVGARGHGHRDRVEHHDPRRGVLHRRVREGRRQVEVQVHRLQAFVRGAATARDLGGLRPHRELVGDRRPRVVVSGCVPTRFSSPHVGKREPTGAARLERSTIRSAGRSGRSPDVSSPIGGAANTMPMPRSSPTVPSPMRFITYATTMRFSRSTTTIEPPQPPQKHDRWLVLSGVSSEISP